MSRLVLTAFTGLLGAGLLLASPDTAVAQHRAPPGGTYKQVSTLVQLPDFVPGARNAVRRSRHPASRAVSSVRSSRQPGELDQHDPAQRPERAEGVQ